MEYMLTFQEPADQVERYQHDETRTAAMAPWIAYMGEMGAAGVMRGGNQLEPAWTATTVRVRGGQRHVQDGPFADSKELVGGYVIIDVPTLDDALAWAAKSPSSVTGSTEVRPVKQAPR